MKIKTLNENDLEFDNGVLLGAFHEQDCCENVYADFGYLKNYNILPHTGETISIYNVEFDEDIENHIQGLQGEGFNLIAKDESKWFVPCHNEQNGYYSSNLTLVVKRGSETKKIDISDFVKDDIE